jgi:hypothetical protein
MTTALLRFQQTFAAQLLRRDAVGPDFGPDAVGLAVHSNNVWTSLRLALETAFPVTRELVGEDFFAVMAERFLTAQPPSVGWLSAYGSEFPDFVARFPPAHSVGYLADIARLEWTCIHAANAPDAPGLDLLALAAFAPEELEGLRLSLHPAVGLIVSAFPIFDIWQSHQAGHDKGGLENLDLARGSQCVLVARIGAFETNVVGLDPADAALLMAISNGASFQAACQAASDADENYNLGLGLGRIVQFRALSQI